MHRITIVRVDSKLRMREWEYWYDDRKHALAVRAYRIYIRQSPRHKWRIADQWGARDARADTLTAPEYDDAADAEAKQQFIQSLTVRR